MAEAQHDMQDALHALRLWRAQIEAHTAHAQEAIEGIGAQARANAYGIAEQGQTIGPPGQRLSTGGASDWVAPKIHPVWAREVAHEARTLQQMGAATFEYEPQYRTLEAWQAAGKPEIAAAEDSAPRPARPALGIDTSAAEGETAWQAQLAQLDVRLAQVKHFTERHAEDQNREQGMSY